MPNYFKPWRRKLGVVTLLMACVFTGGWVRSLVVKDKLNFHDFIDVPYGSLPFDRMVTIPNSIVLVTCHINTVFQTVQIPTPNESQVPSSDASELEVDGNGDLQKVNPTFERREIASIHSVPLIEIPFSAIVIPLTLLSTYLFLTNPRTSTPTKTTEPIATEGK